MTRIIGVSNPGKIIGVPSPGKILGVGGGGGGFLLPYDLAPYKLTLPCDAQGDYGPGGNPIGPALEINPIGTFGRASNPSPWFEQPGDGTLIFTAPDGGATTDTATYARGELRHLTDYLYTTPGEQTVTLSVTTLGVDEKTVVFQIHGGAPDPYDTPYFKVVYQHKAADNGKLYALIKPHHADADVTQTLIAGGLALSNQITLRAVYNGPAAPLDFYVNGSLAAGSVTMNRVFGTYYWKRGNYYQLRRANLLDPAKFCVVKHHPSP